MSIRSNQSHEPETRRELRATIKNEIEKTKLELAALEHALEAISSLDDPRRSGVQATSSEYAGLGLTEATERLLMEKGPLPTQQIAGELLAKGVRTRSDKYVPVVYSTLLNARKRFQRNRLPSGEAVWSLVSSAAPELLDADAIGRDTSPS